MSYHKIVLFFTVMIYVSLVDISVEDCRVMADCDGGHARWQNIDPGIEGRPGKRGMRGPIGQKGEPGLGVNITELNNELEKEAKGLKLYYYASTLTWQSSKTFCHRFGRTLCTHDQVCLPKDGGRELIVDVIQGDHWVPVLDSNNQWVEIGDHHVFPCILHNAEGRWTAPGWGTSTDPGAHKGYVFCCEPHASTESTAPDIRYQYIGKTATYARSLSHCENQGRRLCYSSEVCKANKPVLGMVKGDKWIAVRDRFNEWIQIGDSHARTCKPHGILFDLPPWGLREDGSLLDHVGYVYCCKKSDDA